MATNELSRFLHKLCEEAPVCQIGKHRMSPHDGEDYAALICGLALWGCVLLDQLELLGASQYTFMCKGRIRNVRLLRTNDCVDFTPSFEYIECCYDVLLKHLSSKGGFELYPAIQSLHAVRNTGSPWFSTCIQQLLICLDAVGEEIGSVQAGRVLLQALSFLRKIELSRSDLLENLTNEFILKEDELATQIVPSLASDHARSIINDMNHLAIEHCNSFRIDPLLPKHGPGAVSDPNVHSRGDKYITMRNDRRIQFLLRTHGLGTMQDYNPRLLSEESSRCSRFIGVPKTWKKLRGIAAEPVELQYYQQAVYSSLDRMFRKDKWWSSRVNLHDQSLSCELALKGSANGRFATIDLSAASDSVTLELTKRVFHNTPILKWLLGTRSLYTLIDGQPHRLSKISSMGSAVCFPLECMIFTLAAQVASDRTPGRLTNKVRTIRVFGDDIIVQSECVPALLDILSTIGFSVNSEKSYWEGSFREACGTFALCGVDIRPIRYKRMSWILASRNVDSSDVSQLISFCNQLHDCGYSITRRDLLELFIQKRIPLNHQQCKGSDSLLFSYTGANETVASYCPTNFHLKERWNPGLQRSEYLKLCWSKRIQARNDHCDDQSDVEYIDWLVRHQDGLISDDLDDIRFLYNYVPEIGYTMVPTRKWVTDQFVSKI